MSERLEVLKLALAHRDPAGEDVSVTLSRAEALLAWVQPPLPTITLVEACDQCGEPITDDVRIHMNVGRRPFTQKVPVHAKCVGKFKRV